MWDESCSTIWDPSDYLPPSIVQRVDDLSDADAPRVRANPGILFCSPNICVYAARASLDLRQMSSTDSVSTVASLLNRMWIEITPAIRSLATKNGGQYAYENINLCVRSIQRVSQQQQADMVTRYEASDNAGIYIIFKLSLYEVPLIWFHTCMLAVLLGFIDPSTPLRAPDTSLLLTSPVNFDLWSAKACSDNTLNRRTTLQALICKQMHPAYTFDVQSIDDPGIITR